VRVWNDGPGIDNLGSMTVTLPPDFGPLRRIEETGSTNADMLADPGGPTGEVLVTGHQTSGRGRFDRTWDEAAGSSLLFSIRLRPSFPPAARGWLSALTGVAVADAVARRVEGVSLKWPNDVLVEGKKVAGILAESHGDVAVIGVGCNVTQTAADLPVDTATSLAAAGASDLDLDDLLSDVLAALTDGYAALTGAGGDPNASGLLGAYEARSSTIGTRVVVSTSHGRVEGIATGLSDSGALVLDTGAGCQEFNAGDVEHLR